MPSLINELMLKEVQASVGSSQSLILVDHSLLKSGESLKLRNDLRKAGAKLRVAKVSILIKAVPSSAAKQMESVKGSLGVILAEDMVAASKIVAALAKESRVAVRGGLMDGKSIDAAMVTRISELPGKQELRGMLVNILAAPLTGLVRVLAEIEKKLTPAAAVEPVAAESAPAEPAA